MAGSFSHLMHDDEDGECGWSLIENMGDAYECVEQLLWLILRTMPVSEALRLLNTEFYPMARGERDVDAALREVRKRMTQ